MEKCILAGDTACSLTTSPQTPPAAPAAPPPPPAAAAAAAELTMEKKTPQFPHKVHCSDCRR